jgi:antitoxin component HigA of HigAB toxin-antitoxin module
LKHRYTADAEDDHRRPKSRALEVRRYNGKGAIEEYLVQFEVVARHNQWTKREQAAALLSALDGPACSIIYDLDDVTEATHETIKTALIRRFGTTKIREVHERALEDLKIKKDEDIRQTALEVTKLVKRAYPELSAPQRERFAIKAMIGAMDDPEAAFYVKDKEPGSVDKVCELIEKYEAFRKDHRKQRPTAIRKCQSPTPPTAAAATNQQDLMEKWMKEADGKIQQLTDAVAALVNNTSKPEMRRPPTNKNGDVPRKPCPRCGGPHWARLCPNNQSTSGCFVCGGFGHGWRRCPSGNASGLMSAPDHQSSTVQGQ